MRLLNVSLLHELQAVRDVCPALHCILSTASTVLGTEEILNKYLPINGFFKVQDNCGHI